MPNPRYFYGKPTDMGHVAALPAADFLSLCETFLRQPVSLGINQSEFLSLPESQQNERKKVRYLTPCTFPTDPCERHKAKAGPCNLVFLDVDHAEDAARLLASQWDVMLAGKQYAVYHTARSTETKPRLRVVVPADGIPAAQYGQAVEWLAQRIGVEITPESLRPSQPMYAPTLLQGQTRDPIHVCQTTGAELTVQEIAASPPGDHVDTPPSIVPEPTTTADLSHYREKIEGVTPEDITEALGFLDPDCSMMEWIEVGAGIKHQLGEAGFQLWHVWSQKGRKYTNEKDTAYRWKTLSGQTKDRVPRTIRSVFRLARQRGWANDRLGNEAFKTALAWLKSDRPTEELFDHGAGRIARVVPMVSDTQRETLIQALHHKLKLRGMASTAAAIRKDVEKLEIESERKAHVLPDWAAGLVFVTSAGVFYRYTVARSFTPEVLDLMYTAPALGEKSPPRASVYLVKQAQIPQVENLRYEPAQTERVFTEHGVPFVNTYRATYGTATPGSQDEAGQIVGDHLVKLFKEPAYRELLLDYLCCLVQQPGRKIRWAPLIQSTKGAGKTWFARLASVILGGTNVSKLNAHGVLDRKQNEWAYGHQLVVMEEVRVAGQNRFEVMDKIKTLITDDEIAIEQKFRDMRTVRNNTNYLLFTNYHDALAVQDDERRYFVIKSQIQSREQVPNETYFDHLYAALDRIGGGFRAFFENRPISPVFKADGRAPVTEYLTEMAEAAASPLMAAVMQATSQRLHGLVAPDMVSMLALRRVVDQMEGVPPFSDQALCSILKERGYERSQRLRIDGDRHQIWVKGFVGDVKKTAEDRAEIT